MALERTYIIPLRKEVNKSPTYKRAKKAMNTVRNFLTKHMKSYDVKIGEKINRELWKKGIKNPPGKIKVVATKDDKGSVKAELFGYKYVEKKKVEKVEKSKLEQLKEKMLGKEQEHNKEAIEHIHDEKHPHDHSHAEDTKNIDVESEKERKVASGTAKGKDKR